MVTLIFQCIQTIDSDCYSWFNLSALFCLVCLLVSIVVSDSIWLTFQLVFCKHGCYSLSSTFFGHFLSKKALVIYVIQFCFPFPVTFFIDQQWIFHCIEFGNYQIYLVSIVLPKNGFARQEDRIECFYLIHFSQWFFPLTFFSTVFLSLVFVA